MESVSKDPVSAIYIVGHTISLDFQGFCALEPEKLEVNGDSLKRALPLTQFQNHWVSRFR